MGSRPATEEDPDEAFVIAEAMAATGPLTTGLGIGDDAAILDGGEVVTTDTMVEGVHWDERLSPGDVGWKLVAVNVSDIGAMGARPGWATLAMALPTPLDRGWVTAFFVGFGEAARRFGVAVAGGGTTRSPGPRVLALTAAEVCTRSRDEPAPGRGTTCGFRGSWGARRKRLARPLRAVPPVLRRWRGSAGRNRRFASRLRSARRAWPTP